MAFDTNCFDARISTPCRLLLAGSSGSGKTVWVEKLLRNASILLTDPPTCVVLYYSIWQPRYDALQADGIVQMFHTGVPTMEHLKAFIPGSLVVVDDQALNIDQGLAEIFMVGSRHMNISLCFLTQNIFQGGRHARDLSLNASGVVFFKSPRDQSMIVNFAKQFRPGMPKFFMNVFAAATVKPFSYLYINLEQMCPEEMRIRSCIFPDEFPMKIYQAG